MVQFHMSNLEKKRAPMYGLYGTIAVNVNRAEAFDWMGQTENLIGSERVNNPNLGPERGKER